MDSIGDRVSMLVRAGFSGVWLRTQEPFEAQDELVRMCAAAGVWECCVWDIARGLTWPLSPGRPRQDGQPNPTQPFSAHRQWGAGEGEGDGSAALVVVMHNFHKFLESVSILQGLANAIQLGRSLRVVYVVLAPTGEIPAEVERAFTRVSHPPPGPAELRAIADGLLAGNGLGPELLDGPCVEAARGLTRREAENAFSLSLLGGGDAACRAEAVWGLAEESIRSTGFMTLVRPREGFESLGGLGGLKEFSRALLTQTRGPAQGLLLLGMPGGGKTAFTLALGKETGRPVLLLNFGLLHNKYVGGSEHNLSRALDVADAKGRCILMVDEIEKALAGAGGGGDSDSGVSQRTFGQLLTWLSDRERKGSEVMFVGTANNMAHLPKEFSRAGRFDATFFIDLPTAAERAVIWRQYLERYGVGKGPGVEVDDSGWTGAEIRQACRLSSLLGVSLKAASRFVTPVSVRNREEIEELRRWASGRCQCANSGMTYQAPGPEALHGPPGQGPSGAGRRIEAGGR